MPYCCRLLQVGSVAGIAGLTFASFTAVSYLEVKKRIDEQISAGEDPYELRVETKTEQRSQPPRKASGGKKAGSSKRKK
jgi:hypothetical protein